MKGAASRVAAASIAAALVTLAAVPAPAEEPFSYNPPGMLTPGSGDGRFDEKVYAPGMRFPIESGPAFLNSQVWGHGGSQGPGGGQCDAENRQFPWWDNYCETRTWDMPLCPAGQGHQGQDIRAGDCAKDTHWVVAAVDGTITNIGSYSVYLTAEDGTRFDYLHMSDVQVALNDEVKRGDKLGLVSNEFGGTPTTIHLHFNIKQNVSGIGFVFVPPYMSLVTSYQALINTGAKGALSGATCERVRGASFDPDTPDVPSHVRVSVGGTWDDPGALQLDLPADRPTDALCDEGAAPCARGFDSMLPIALLDGQTRDLHFYALDTWVEGAPVELEQSPASVSCELFSTEKRVRRLVEGDLVAADWGFSLPFDQLLSTPEETEAVPEGAELPRKPHLVASADGSARWILDLDALRPISDDAMFAFRLDAAQAEVWSDEEVALTPLGPAWPSRPAIARGQGATLYLLDHASGVDHVGGLLDGEGDGDGDGAPEAAGCLCGATPGGAGAPGGALAAAAICLVSAWMRRGRHRSTTRTPFVR